MGIKNFKFFFFIGSCKRTREGAIEIDRLGGLV